MLFSCQSRAVEGEQDWHAGAAPAAVGLAGRQNACGRCHERASVWARPEGPAQPGPRLTTWPSRGLAWPLTSEDLLAASAQVWIGRLEPAGLGHLPALLLCEKAKVQRPSGSKSGSRPSPSPRQVEPSCRGWGWGGVVTGARNRQAPWPQAFLP